MSQDKLKNVYYWTYNVNIQHKMTYVKIRVSAYTPENARDVLYATILKVLRKGIPYIILDYNYSNSIVGSLSRNNYEYSPSSTISQSPNFYNKYFFFN